MPRFGDLLGESAALVGLRRELEQLVRRYATARRLPPVLLLGETGTGKSMIARALHAEGPRAARPFVDVACPEIPPTLMESEMFGVERGAFTDARQSRPGRFAEADRGTIFLDEIGLLPDTLQSKLLKIVEEQQLRPLGATGSKPIDVWIIAATSDDLEVAVRKRRFREDLYFRLAVVTLRVPPLRERADDVVILARHLLARACADYGLEPKTFTADALAALKAYRWPGNIRELGNVIERVALRAERPRVTAAVLALPDVAPPSATESEPEADERPAIDAAVADVERTHLIQALEAARGNVSRAAQQLGLTRNTFRYRLRKHGLARGPSEATAPLAPAPPMRPSGPARWERRRIAFLRVALAATDETVEHRRRTLLDAVREKIVGFGGKLDGVSPGGVTAVFGLDLLEDAPRRAAHAAMAIRKLGLRARDTDTTLPALRLAIHAAPALLWKTADDVHVDAETRIDVWQTLDRLVVSAADNSIVVSESTTALLSTFQMDAAGLLLDGERAATPRTARGVFAGRRDEMAMLRGRFELALAGRGQVVGLAGEPGIGKSRALFEFRRALAPDTVAYFAARSHSYGGALPLLPIIELLRRVHGIEDDDSPDVVRDKLRSRLNVLGLPAEEMLPYLARVLGTGEGADTIAHLSAQELHQRTLEIFRAIVLATSRAGPVIISVEDLHWMDRASEAYLAALVDSIVEAPVLLLTTYRTGHRPVWNERSYASELRLQPLARADAHLVLDAALGGERRASPLPTAIAEAILDRADGNPFFIEELARAMGSVAEAPTSVPESIEAVLLARIDRLPGDAKSVLQAASVLGRDVPVRLLEAITPEVETAMERLRDLQQLEYLHARSDGAHQLYRFKHALTQEVAYSSLLVEHRRALHARVVDAVELQYAGRLAEQTETLAHHAVRGELWERAAPYLRQAGLKAADRSANHEAVAYLEQALEALDRLPADRWGSETADVHLDLARILVPLASYDDCLKHLADAAQLAEARQDRGRRGRALAQQCLVLRITGATPAAIQAGRAALAIAAELRDDDLAITASFFLGTAHYTRGEFREAAACYRQGVIPPAGEVLPERARTLHRYAGGVRAWLAWTLESLGEFGEALVLGREGIELADAWGDRAAGASRRCLLANVHLGLGDAASAVPLLERSLILCRSYDVRDWLGFVMMRLGFAYAQVGRHAEGIRLLEDGEAHCKAFSGITGHATRLAGFAQSLLLAGRDDAAAETARRGIALAREQHQPAGGALCLRALGMIAAAANPPDATAAEACFTEAREMAIALGMRPLVAHCHLGLGKLHRNAGRHAEAQVHLDTAQELYRAMGMQRGVGEATAASISAGD